MANSDTLMKESAANSTQESNTPHKDQDQNDMELDDVNMPAEDDPSQTCNDNLEVPDSSMEIDFIEAEDNVEIPIHVLDTFMMPNSRMIEDRVDEEVNELVGDVITAVTSHQDTMEVPTDEPLNPQDIPIKVYNEDETLQALSLYLDYEFEAPHHRPHHLDVSFCDEVERYDQLHPNEDHEGPIENPNIITEEEEEEEAVAVPFCKFIDDEPSISSEPDRGNEPQDVLQDVLIPCLYGYLQDFRLIENISNEKDLIQEAERRTDLLDKLNSQLLLDRKSWRLRARFSKECLELCRARKITPEQVNHIICCFALTFMDDSVNGVRKQGAELLAEIFSIFIAKEWPANAVTLNEDVDGNTLANIIDAMPLTKSLLVDSRRGFLKSNSWRRRQTYSAMLEFLIKTEISMQQYFFIFGDDIQAIVNDKVANTRMNFCTIFEAITTTYNLPLFNELFPSLASSYIDILNKMAENDSDYECQTRAQLILGHLEPLTDPLDYDVYYNQLIERENRMWKKWSETTGKPLQDMMKPKDIIVKEFDTIQCLSIEEV